MNATLADVDPRFEALPLRWNARIDSQIAIDQLDAKDGLDALRADLTARRIGTEIYYPIPLHLQVCFASLVHKPGDFPVSETAAGETIALPMYPELSATAQRYVVAAIARFLREEAPYLADGERAA